MSITALVDSADLELEARQRGASRRSLRARDGRRRPVARIGSAAQSVPVRPHLRRTHPAAPGGRPQGVSAPELRAATAWPTMVTPTEPPSARLARLGPIGVEQPIGVEPVGVEQPRVAELRVALRRPAVSQAVRTAPGVGLRLTDRGIALVLGVFAVLMVLAGAAVVTTFWQVTGPGSPYGR